MSWKIYDAYVYSGNANKLLQELQTIRNEYLDYCMNRLIRIWPLVYHVVTNDKKNRWHFYRDITVFALADQFKRTAEKGLRHRLNLEASAVYIPWGRKILVMMFADGFDVLHDHPDFRDFHWQTSTDRPKEISPQDWAARKKVWTKVFKGNRAPVDVGFTFEITTRHFYLELADRLLKQVIMPVTTA